MMFIHGIDNNTLNSGALFSRAYQEESKMQELLQEINMFWGQNQTKKLSKWWCLFLHQH